MHQSILLILTLIAFFCSISSGLYIKKTIDGKNLKTRNDDNKDEWSVFQQKLGLTKEKLEILKSQKDQQRTLELLNRFISENPMYKETTHKKHHSKPSNTNFVTVYHKLLKQLKLSRSTLKTSLNFELADKTQRNVKRSRRKIAVRMVSDMPSENIDDLLKIFNKKHGINNSEDNDDEDEEIDEHADKSEYSELPMNLSSAINPDYMYEDEKDMNAPIKSDISIQDLILQSSNRNQWQRETEESELLNSDDDHFI